MDTYTIKPGNVASACYIITPEGKELFYAYMAEDKQPDNTHDPRVPPFSTLPLEVRASVNRHFGTVFSLPLERRGEYMQACIPWTVEA